MRRRQRGIALITALYILTIIFVLALYFRAGCEMDRLLSQKIANRAQLYYLAEAGIEYYLAKSPDWTDGNPPTAAEPPGENPINIPAGSDRRIYLKVTQAAATITVESKATLSAEQSNGLGTGWDVRIPAVTITAVIENDGGKIRSWNVSYRNLTLTERCFSQ